MTSGAKYVSGATTINARGLSLSAPADLDSELEPEELAGGDEQDPSKPSPDAELEAVSVEDESEGAADEAEVDLDGDGDSEPGSEDLEEIEDEGIDEELEVPDSELGDDPVSMYLKEIGQVRLLDADQEIWLATQMSAVRRLTRATEAQPRQPQGIRPGRCQRPEARARRQARGVRAT